MYKKFCKVLLIFLNLLLSIGGFFGGISFITDPTGASIGAKLEWLQKVQIVDNYFLPGIFLFVMWGFLPLVAIYGIFAKKPWVLKLNAFIGVALVLWIIFEFLVLPEKMFLQYIMIGQGLAIFGLTFYLQKNDK